MSLENITFEIRALDSDTACAFIAKLGELLFSPRFMRAARNGWTLRRRTASHGHQKTIAERRAFLQYLDMLDDAGMLWRYPWRWQPKGREVEITNLSDKCHVFLNLRTGTIRKKPFSRKGGNHGND